MTYQRHCRLPEDLRAFQLCGTAVTSAQVSRTSGWLDKVLEAWRKCPLGEIVYLDAGCGEVRLDGQIPDAAILIAWGFLSGRMGTEVSIPERL